MPLTFDTPVEIVPLRAYNDAGAYEPITGLIIGIKRNLFTTRYIVAYLAYHEESKQMITVKDYFKRSELLQIHE